MKFLIIGLGNIGLEYAHTRHNIGFDIIDAFAQQHNASFTIEKYALKSEIKFKGKILILIKPTTFMNLSGIAVKYWLTKENISIENSLTIVDDLALNLDTIKLKKQGTDAGHNGLKSLQENLGTTQYPRLKFGIGNNFSKGKQVAFVLGKWNDKELSVVNNKIESTVEMIESFVHAGIDNTMTLYNNKKYV